MRVAAGSIAKIALATPAFGGVKVRGYLSQLGPIVLDESAFDWDEIERNAFFWPNAAQVSELETYMQRLSKEGDSIGAKVTVVAENVPPGWGEPVFDRLDADIAHALMSINAVKGVEIGAGFEAVSQRGTEHRDEITSQNIVASLALKPTSSIRLPGQSVDVNGNDIEVITTGRHDPCVGIRATPIAEAMLALTLIDHAMRHRAQNNDVQCSTPIIPGSRS